MIRVGYLQCQVNVIINKYATYKGKTLKSSTVKRLLKALYCCTADYRGR